MYTILNTGGLNIGMAVQEAVERGTIAQLPDIVSGLQGYDREVFDGVMRVTARIGRLDSNTLSLDGLRAQRVVKIQNIREHVVAKISELRALRAQESIDGSTLDAEIEKQKGNDDFCLEKFETHTPLNVFGRIRGGFCATGGNLYLAGVFHAIQTFFEHDPRIPPTRDQFLDRMGVADRWFEAANKVDERAIYSSYFQNNLDRAGASVWFHGHAQLQQEQDCHEGEMEELLEVFHSHRWKTGRDYFQDLFRAHQAVGLGVEQNGVMVIPSLTPVKERHIRMIAYLFDEPQREVFFKIVRHFMDESGFGVKAFNFSIGYRPISYDGRDWGGFPAVIADLVDRGDINKRNNDIGASEYLLKSPIVSTDPYRVQDGIEKALKMAA